MLWATNRNTWRILSIKWLPFSALQSSIVPNIRGCSFQSHMLGVLEKTLTSGIESAGEVAGDVCRKKRRAQICGQIQRFIQNSYRTTQAERVTSTTHTPNTSAERKIPKLIKLKQYRVKRNVSLLDSHMLTSSSFFSLQTQHDQSQRNRNTTNKHKNKEKQRGVRVPCVGLSYVKLCDTAALVH